MRKYIDIPCPQLGYNTLSRKAFASGDCIIIVTRDVYPDGAVRWHLSISCAPIVTRLGMRFTLRLMRFSLMR
jgi:hypothetical protein